MPRLLLAAFVVALILVLLAWFHLIPGGWFLRNLLESPEAREARLMAEHRQERLASFVAGPETMPPGCILFIGSSTLERFPLESSFPKKPTLNRGIGGEPARLTIERLEESLPKAGREEAGGAVLYSGTIDFRIDRVDVATARQRVADLVEALRRMTRDDLPILLLGPLPGNEDDDRYRGRGMEELEAALRELARAEGLDFSPARPRALPCRGRRPQSRAGRRPLAPRRRGLPPARGAHPRRRRARRRAPRRPMRKPVRRERRTGFSRTVESCREDYLSL